MTRAELYRYLSERRGPKRAPAVRPHHETLPDEASRPRNVSRRAGKKAQFALEACARRPSRKSTRKAANRQKNDIQFRMRRRTSESRPQDLRRP